MLRHSGSADRSRGIECSSYNYRAENDHLEIVELPEKSFDMKQIISRMEVCEVMEIVLGKPLLGGGYSFRGKVLDGRYDCKQFLTGRRAYGNLQGAESVFFPV